MSWPNNHASARRRTLAACAAALLIALVGGCARHPNNVAVVAANSSSPTGGPTAGSPLPTPEPSTERQTNTGGGGSGHTSASPSSSRTTNSTPSGLQISGVSVSENFSIKAASAPSGLVSCYWTANSDPHFATVFVPLVIGHTGGIPLHGPTSVQFRLSHNAGGSAVYSAPFTTHAYDLPVPLLPGHHNVKFTAELLLSLPDSDPRDDRVRLNVDVDSASPPPTTGSALVDCSVAT